MDEGVDGGRGYRGNRSHHTPRSPSSPLLKGIMIHEGKIRWNDEKSTAGR